MRTNNIPQTEKGGSGFFSGVMIGAALGALAGVLFAPGPGDETRKKLKAAKKKVEKTVGPIVEEFTTTISPLVEDAVQKVEPVVKKVADSAKKEVSTKDIKSSLSSAKKRFFKNIKK
ncbi:MAG: YtxH domain-containing protein [Patescibacteria group bacterium]|nr:YtxH domain-containing protein [Patescibacteria group bacterium]